MLRRRGMGICAAIAAMAAPVWAEAQTAPVGTCRPAGSVMRLANLPEASGLAASRTTAGRLWAHNDSGKPVIFALDTNGKVTGSVTVAGVKVVDWEAMASAPCGKGACLYIADIGDNSADRNGIVIYRIQEPAQVGGSVQAEAIRAIYPDGAHDAEALLAAPNGGLYIVTKGETGHVALYRVPEDAKAGSTVRLELVGKPIGKRTSSVDARVTDGAISPDGEWAVLRTTTALTFYRTSDFFKGDFREARRVDLKSLGEPQGEGVAFGPSNTVYLAGEGGGKSRPGTLAILSCTL